MHIAIAGGHSAIARGASGYLDEYECDRAFVDQLIDAFDAQGWHVTDCSNEEPDVSAELREECRIANASGARNEKGWRNQTEAALEKGCFSC